MESMKELTENLKTALLGVNLAICLFAVSMYFSIWVAAIIFAVVAFFLVLRQLIGVLFVIAIALVHIAEKK